MSSNTGKVLGTTAVWGGVAALCYVLGSMNHLDGLGAGLMIFAAFVLTAGIWKMN